MRVISGEKKGTFLKSVQGVTTRPTSDKVKAAIFNMIGPYFSGGKGLDLYAGSGALGIEALSRGLDKVIFIDRDYQAVKTIKDNLKRTQLQERAEVYRNQSLSALQKLKDRENTFTYIFLDPPYVDKDIHQVIDTILTFNLLQKDGEIIVEHAKASTLPTEIKDLWRRKFVVYGNTAISIFTFKEE